MKTFETENGRKEELFGAWNDYLIGMRGNPDVELNDEVFEGIAEVLEVSKDRMSLKLDDGRKIWTANVSDFVCHHTRRLDQLYLVLVRIVDEWHPVEVVSIGSVVKGRRSGIHMTFNPEIADFGKSMETSIH